MKTCKTPGAHFHIGIGPRVVSCKVDIPFDLGLTKAQAVSLENKVHDAMERVLLEYWQFEEELELNYDETFEELLERRLKKRDNQ